MRVKRLIDDEAARERLRKQIDTANVSEAAKELYRKHLTVYRTSGGWGDEGYELLKELDKAGLVMTSLVYLDPETGIDVIIEDGLLKEEEIYEDVIFGVA